MGRAYQNRKESMAKTSDMKAKVYSRYGREIYVCAKSGGPDPDGNLALRSLIDRAKKDQVPAHVIEKAIEKSQGVGGEDFSPALYEGFGPGGTMVLVECLTDNPNRTFGDVRLCFTKSKCKLGTPGTVSHLFDHSAIFVFKGDEEAVLDALMEADVDVTDIENEDGMISVFAPNTEYFKAKQALLDLFSNDIEFEVDEIQYLPQVSVALSGDDIEQFEKLITLLDDNDDAQNIYHNAEV
jgi:YebC/PmpR family DNA-binding regulatory protein